jgi:probable F420-dependent oxidoreductase
MLLGMSLPQDGSVASRDAVSRVAREAEAIGLDSLWVLDRVFRPRTPIARAPGETAQPLPKFYASIFDPLETLTFAAALTERVLLGTSVVIAPLHPPVVLGKRFATLDALSSGRVIAGLGMGWMPEEFAVAGVPMTGRVQRMGEYVDALRAVWGPDPVRFAGRVYQIPESDIGPKPVRGGGIPIVIGAYAASAIARAGRFADGFNPLATTFDALSRDVTTFHNAAREAGRNPDELQIILRVNASLHDQASKETLFSGSVDRWAEDVARVAELGVSHVFFAIDGPIEDRLRMMERLRALV